MKQESEEKVTFDEVPPIQFIFQNISVEAKIEKQVPNGKGGYKKEKTTRTILKDSSGKFEPGTVTAILGPSGSGKTTMLNLLSGRLLSKNIVARGLIKINGRQVISMAEYKNAIGYVMQQDVLLPTFTPRQAFRFITDMRLRNKSNEEKDSLVESMIVSLGLSKCANTYVGNNLIKGLSGGEKKRTSIGVELLINPSVIFLDEPTTGLDSTTALNLVKFLNKLAGAGRTVVTTIHQPSSEIFLEFDTILLLLDGHIVYHDRAADSMRYFGSLGLTVPVHSNPMDHYMKLLNKEGIMMAYMQKGQLPPQEEIDRQFEERVQMLVQSYKKMQKRLTVNHNNQLQQSNVPASWFTQTVLLLNRSFVNQLRNPMGLGYKIFQAIFVGITGIMLFERRAKTLDGYIQNVMGMLFFFTINLNFMSTFGYLNIFSLQRAVFIRQKQSNTYGTTPYFIGRTMCYIPIQLLIPVIMLCVCYFVLPLDHDGDSFFLTVAASWLGFWLASSYGLLLSAIFPDGQIALSTVPLLVIPLMVISGFFTPLQNIPDFFRPFEYVSSYFYLFQAYAYAQFFDDRRGFTVQLRQSTATQTYTQDILGEGNQLYFQEPFWLSMFLMGIVGLVIRVLCVLALHFISNPKSLKLLPPISDKNIINQVDNMQSSKPINVVYSTINSKQTLMHLPIQNL